MKLLSFNNNSKENVGAKIDEGIVDLPASYFNKYKETPPSYLFNLREFFENLDAAERLTEELISDEEFRVVLSEKSLKMLPLLKPRKILCVAVNYGAHAKEAGGASVEEPYVFTKFPDNVVAPNENLLLPKASKQFDHELELAVVIGKKGKYITQDEAFDYIAGYTVFNDVSFRDRRIHSSKRYITNWLHGKNMDRSAPFGPYIVTKDEIPDPHNLHMTIKVNGEVRQDGNTEGMIHRIPEILEYISSGITLYPGDIISTGTVTGSGLGTGKFLNDGDVLEATIEKIGTLVNKVVAENYKYPI